MTVAPAASIEKGVVQCGTCGLVLGRTKEAAVLGKLAVKRVRADELTEAPVLIGEHVAEEAQPVRAGPHFPVVLLAEDLVLHQRLLTDGLAERGLSGQVVVSARGDAFLTDFTSRLLRGEPPDLCILDIEMPGLNGYHAAVAMRAVERAFGQSPIPVLFCTARICDDAFRLAMESLGRAQYINKATTAGAEPLFVRMEQVLRTFQGLPALQGPAS